MIAAIAVIRFDFLSSDEDEIPEIHIFSLDSVIKRMRETWGRQNIGTEMLVRVKHAAFNHQRNFSQVRSKRTAGTDFVCLR